ncbi:MAG TPA: hypothetical protein VJW20_15190 [Candidatus Angelobacter sp.]|nr:hypothetical protein [Candidatus Angelobacter sp.]
MRPVIFAALLIVISAPSRPFDSSQISTDCSPYPREAAQPCVLAIHGGDLVKPVFSPDNRYLAFATVTTRPQKDSQTDEFSELDGTLVADLQTRKVKIFLTPDQARKYASYSASICQIRWRTRDSFSVTYADGDVDSDDLTFRLRDGKLLSTKHASIDDPPPSQPETPDDTVLTPDQARKLLPHFPASLSLESGRLSSDRTLLALVVGNEPHRQLLIFRLHPSKKL